MIEKKDILKMAKHVFRRGQGLPDKRLLHPKREWIIGLIFFVVVLIVGGIVSARLFVTYQDINIEVVDSGEQVPRYNQSMIQTALETFQERKNKFDVLQPKNEIISEEDVVEETGGEKDTATSSDSVETNGVTDEVVSEKILQEEDDEPIGLEAN